MDRRNVLRLFTFIAASTTCSVCSAQLTLPKGEVDLSGPQSTNKKSQKQNGFAGAHGCTGFGASSTSPNIGAIVPSCGVAIIDQALPIEAQLLTQIMGSNPSLYFLADFRAPNAFALPGGAASFTSSDGAILFGVRLLSHELSNNPWWGAAIAGILAHEWGHIKQFSAGATNPGKTTELHADFLAGWYLGCKQRRGIAHVVVGGLSASLYQKGDYDFYSRTHHGTPDQRVNAMSAGFQFALNRPMEFSSAFAAGRNYVTSL